MNLIIKSEAKCKVFVMKMSFHSYANKTNFHVKSFCTLPCFHNEVHSNSEMAYCVAVSKSSSQINMLTVSHYSWF